MLITLIVKHVHIPKKLIVNRVDKKTNLILNDKMFILLLLNQIKSLLLSHPHSTSALVR